MWDGRQFVNGSVFFGLPVYVFGRPITEPYWVRTAVKGVEQDVLVQLFERRVLTYTPKNPDGFKVEMGNVGQHYYRWRYELNARPAQNPTKAEFVTEFGHDKTGLKNPYFIAVDSQDYFYVTAMGGNQIYRYDNQGRFLGTLGQPTASSDPGKFDNIIGMGVDAANNLYVADTGNHRVQKFDSQGHNTALWVMPKRDPKVDYYPHAMTVDAKGNVYLLDHVGIIVCDNRGFVITQWENPGPADNQVNMPSDIGVDPQGNVYIMDNYNIANQYLRGTVKKFDTKGHFLLKWDAGSWPPPLKVDRQGNVLIGLNKYDSNGNYLGYLGQQLPTGPSNSGGFNETIDQSNNIFVTDSGNSLVTKLDEKGKLLATYGTYGRGDGQLRHPTSVVTDGEGNIFVYDSYNHRIQKFDANGRFLLKWGKNGTADSLFSNTEVSLAVDDQGNIYAGDAANRRIMKYDGQGHLLLEIGQDEQTSYCQGKLEGITAVTVDNYGFIYVAQGINTNNCIQKFDRTGKFVLQWGMYSQVDLPSSIAADRQGHLYIADANKDQVNIYDTFGRFVKSWSTEDTRPNLYSVNLHLTLDNQGNVYTLNASNGRITKYDSQGNLLFYWGNGGAGAGQFMNPNGIAVDSQGNIFVADSFNDRVEKFKQS